MLSIKKSIIKRIAIIRKKKVNPTMYYHKNIVYLVRFISSIH